MFSNEDTTHTLEVLGTRLLAARLAKGDSQELFAKRIGVSVPTLRDMERGSPNVAVGTWIAALWMLSRLADLDSVLVKKDSLFERVERQAKTRLRAPRRPRERAT